MDRRVGRFRQEVERLGQPSPRRPVEDFLGPRTRKALATAYSADSFIISRQMFGNLASAQILATGQPLSGRHIQMIRETAFDPDYFYQLHACTSERMPPDQDFAIQLHGDSDVLDLMIGLKVGSWGFYCGDEKYQDWGGGPIFKMVAQETFPELASPHASHVWRGGVVAALERSARARRR